MDRISIVIVSYNVRYFLKQCLQSVLNSKLEAELELIVVDNNSSDASVEMIKKEFPEVICIQNKSNLGFSKANNQGFNIATGDYVLILNPDTIIEENSLQLCLDYYRNHSNVGAIGVRMTDGSGNYLPESKRGFPTPLRSLFKISGLSRIFKRSAWVNGYYLGQLSQYENHEVDVLTGAFIFLDRKTLDEVGGFDEDYFMYGEDIEMSYQIRRSGKRIIYLAETSIIHFKGESTHKSSLNYLKRFYGAMQIYAKKRNSSSSWIWKLILNMGILTAGFAAFLKTIMNFLIWPLINLFALVSLMKTIQLLWAKYYYGSVSYYSDNRIELSIAFLSLTMVMVFYVLGHFDKKYSTKQWIYASFLSALVLLALYGLFPIDFRFSRSILLIYLILAPPLMYIMRCLHNKITKGNFSFDAVSDKRLLVVGTDKSFEMVRSLIENIYKSSGFIGRVGVESDGSELGELADLPSIIKSRFINELIFCSKDVAAQEIFRIISSLDKNVSVKIASNDNKSILGSNSKDSMGEWFTAEIDLKIKQEFHQRTKRLIDISFVLLFVIFIPIVFLFSKERFRIYANIFSVLLGRKTWISYNPEDPKLDQLPALKEGIFTFRVFEYRKSNPHKHSLNMYYSRNYNIWMEIDQLIRNVFFTDKETP